MSPRSQSARIGKSEMPVCSEAWSEPRKCSPWRRRVSSIAGGAAHQSPTVSNSTGGRSSGVWSITSWPWMRLRSKPTTRSVTFSRPSQAWRGPTLFSSSTSRISVSFSVSGVVK